MVVVDPAIEALFGEAPAGLDLNESTTKRDDAVVIALAVVAVLSVAGRVWARHLKAAPLWLDDWLVFAALILNMVTTALTVLGGRFSSGHHIWAAPLWHLKGVFQILYAYTYVYGGSAAAIKLSFVLYFTRIFHTGTPWSIFRLRDFTSCTLVIGVVLSITFPLMVWTVMLGVCKPIHYFWDEYSHPGTGTCIDSTLFLLVAGIINMVIDTIIVGCKWITELETRTEEGQLLIPIPPICKLQVKLSEKLMLIGIFMLGSFVCVASAMRIHYLTILRTDVDLTWSMGPVFIWSSVEPALGIVSSCLISLRPVITRLMELLFRTQRTNPGTSITSHGLSRQDANGIYDGRARGRRRTHDDELALVTIDGGDTLADGSGKLQKEGFIHVVRDFEVHGSASSSTSTPSQERCTNQSWEP